MSELSQNYTKKIQQSSIMPVRLGFLQQRYANGQQAVVARECEEYRQKREGMIQRAAVISNPVQNIPPIVKSVLHSSGQTLDAEARGFMESRFGHDFSSVRVHTDAQAAESARSVNALAYTVGRDIVFDQGQYRPETPTGKQLLGHELMHVVQQGHGLRRMGGEPAISTPGGMAEREAIAAASSILQGEQVAGMHQQVPAQMQRMPQDDDPIHQPIIENFRQQQGLSPGGVDEFGQRVGPSDAEIKYGRKPTQSGLDEEAMRIIQVAQNLSRDKGMRAVEVVWRIIGTYFSLDASKVRGVGYEAALKGLRTESHGKGSDTTGMIYVGDDFLQHTDNRNFARHVLQVGHEIEHINQYRAGLGGKNNQNEREFLAFYHEALGVEKAGTGRMQHATRVTLIDAAIGYYYCLSAQLQQQYASNQRELLNRRATEATKGGNAPTSPPTGCKTQ